MTTAEQGRALHRARQDLISLKWRIDETLESGIPLDEIARTLGKPWTPALVVQAFPDVARKHELDAIPPTPLAEPRSSVPARPTPWQHSHGGIERLTCAQCDKLAVVVVDRSGEGYVWRCPTCGHPNAL